MSVDRFNELASEVKSILDQNDAILNAREAGEKVESMSKDHARTNREYTLRKLSLWSDTN